MVRNILKQIIQSTSLYRTSSISQTMVQSSQWSITIKLSRLCFTQNYLSCSYASHRRPRLIQLSFPRNTLFESFQNISSSNAPTFPSDNHSIQALNNPSSPSYIHNLHSNDIISSRNEKVFLLISASRSHTSLSNSSSNTPLSVVRHHSQYLRSIFFSISLGFLLPLFILLLYVFFLLFFNCFWISLFLNTSIKQKQKKNGQLIMSVRRLPRISMFKGH